MMSDTALQADLETLTAANRRHFQLAAQYYNHKLSPRQVDVGFWVKQARRYGGPVLELGCGTGRILLPIANAGVEITGIDASDSMLRRLHDDLAAQPAAVQKRVQVIHGVFPQALPAGPFRQVFLTFGVFQYVLTDHDLLLGRLRDMLTSDGRLIVDVRSYQFSGDTEQVKPPEIYEDENFIITLNRSVRYDSVTQLLTEALHITVSDRTNQSEISSSSEHVMRTYHRYELEYLLRLNGFRIVALYGDYDCNPYSSKRPSSTSRRILYVAEPA